MWRSDLLPLTIRWRKGVQGKGYSQGKALGGLIPSNGKVRNEFNRAKYGNSEVKRFSRNDKTKQIVKTRKSKV